MFNKKRGGALYWALGIAGAVVAAAGTGTWFFASRSKSKRTRELTAQAKRVVRTVSANKRKPTNHAKTNHTNHARTNHAHN